MKKGKESLRDFERGEKCVCGAADNRSRQGSACRFCCEEERQQGIVQLNGITEPPSADDSSSYR